MAAYRAVESVPEEWTAYRHARGTPTIRTGAQNLYALDDLAYVKSYYLIDLLTGTVRQLLNAPEGTGYGWWGFRPPLWSARRSNAIAA